MEPIIEIQNSQKNSSHAAVVFFSALQYKSRNRHKIEVLWVCELELERMSQTKLITRSYFSHIYDCLVLSGRLNRKIKGRRIKRNLLSFLFIFTIVSIDEAWKSFLWIGFMIFRYFKRKYILQPISYFDIICILSNDKDDGFPFSVIIFLSPVDRETFFWRRTKIRIDYGKWWHK